MSKVFNLNRQAIPLQKRELPANQDQKLREVSKKYEKYFLGEMYKAMRKTASPNGYMKPSMAEKIYQDKLDQEYVDVWGNKGGIGLNELIYNELKEKILPQIYGAPQKLRPSDLKPLNAQPEVYPLSDPPAEKVQKSIDGKELKFEIPKGKNGQSAKILNPMGGTIESISKDSNGAVIAVINHGEQLQSQLKFKGDPRLFSVGDSSKKGDVIGHLDPASQTLIWQMRGRV